MQTWTDVTPLLKYCVYKIYDADGILLYVGSGSLDRSIISYRERRVLGGRIEVTPTETRKKAFELEARVILEDRPKLNKYIPGARVKTTVQVNHRRLPNRY